MFFDKNRLKPIDNHSPFIVQGRRRRSWSFPGHPGFPQEQQRARYVTTPSPGFNLPKAEFNRSTR